MPRRQTALRSALSADTVALNKAFGMTTIEAGSLAELTKRQLFSLDMFRSQSHQDGIFKFSARECLIRGGNRSGKSVCAAVLFAAIAMDKKVTLSDGTKVDARRPHQKNKPLTMWVIGFDGKHIGQTIHRLLFRSGPAPVFYMIRGEDKQWRSYDFSSPADVARESERRNAPPLIPNRYIKPKSWSWEDKAARHFNQVTIVDPVTGDVLADIYAFSSMAEPKAGDPVDVIWIDEAVQYPEHYAEWKSRLSDRRGWMFWSSWPKADNEALQSLTQNAEAQKDREDPLYQEVVLAASANKQIDEQGKEQQLASYTEEERLSRDLGMYLTEGTRMYPMFEKSVHAAYRECPMCQADLNASCTCKDSDDEIGAILRKNRGEPPNDWMRELILDPGTNSPAVLLCAVPPPHLGSWYVPYREIYPGRKSADELAPLVKQVVGWIEFQRFIIDHKAGAITPMSYGLTIEANYGRAFAENGLACNSTGSRFSWGSSNVGGRIMNLQGWMHCAGGRPRLRIVTAMCPKLCDQLKSYQKAVVNKNPVDDRPANGQKIDLAVALEYWAASDPIYYAPKEGNSKFPDTKYRWFKKAFGKSQSQTSFAARIGS